MMVTVEERGMTSSNRGEAVMRVTGKSTKSWALQFVRIPIFAVDGGYFGCI